jgi:hypothetical protein
MRSLIRFAFKGVARTPMSLADCGVTVWWIADWRFSAATPHDQYTIKLIGADPDQIVQKIKELTIKP